MAESNQNEVRVALVMDDQATATLNKVAEAMAALHKKQQDIEHAGKESGSKHGEAHGNAFVHGLKEKFTEGVMMAAGGAAIEMLADKLHEIPELFKEAFHAGVEELEGQRSIAGVLSMTGVNGSFGQVLDQAKLYKDSLEDLGVEAGVTDQVLQEVFEGIAARSNKSAVEVEELTEKIAYAGKAIKGGPAAIAQGFQMMEMGMIRAKNPVVQMITAAHLLQGNAKAVAAQLMKMTPEKQLELGEKAIEKMSQKMKDAPPTFNQLITSLSALKEQTFEALGVPMVEALVPHLDTLKHWLIAHKDEIENYARDVARFLVGSYDNFMGWVNEVKHLFDDKQLKEGLEDAAAALKTAFGFGVEAAKIYYGTMMAAGVGIVKAFEEVKTTLLMGAKFGTFGDVGKRAYFEHERASATADFGSDIKYSQNPLYGKSAQAQLDRITAANRAYEGAGGTLTKEDEESFKQLQEQLKAAALAGEEARNFAEKGNVDQLSKKFNEASQKHEDGMRYYIARLIGGNDQLQDALIKSGVELSGGFAGVVQMLKESGLSDQADALAKKVKAAGAKTSSPVVNFNGGQTFQIKQDFRDQDPDRIAVLFRQDILKAAQSRVQSSRATPFGF